MLGFVTPPDVSKSFKVSPKSRVVVSVDRRPCADSSPFGQPLQSSLRGWAQFAHLPSTRVLAHPRPMTMTAAKDPARARVSRQAEATYRSAGAAERQPESPGSGHPPP